MGTAWIFLSPLTLLDQVGQTAPHVLLSSRPVKRLLHLCRDFLRLSVFSFESTRRPKDFAGLGDGWDLRRGVRESTYALLVCNGGPAIVSGGLWTGIIHSLICGGDPTCVRCQAAPETVSHRLWHCAANQTFRRALDASLSRPDILDSLPSCARRCGILPRRNQLSIDDVLALHNYLASVNAHATASRVAASAGRPLPSPESVHDMRLPTSAIYDSSLPPMKRTKLHPRLCLEVGGQTVTTLLPHLCLMSFPLPVTRFWTTAMTLSTLSVLMVTPNRLFNRCRPIVLNTRFRYLVAEIPSWTRRWFLALYESLLMVPSSIAMRLLLLDGASRSVTPASGTCWISVGLCSSVRCTRVILVFLEPPTTRLSSSLCFLLFDGWQYLRTVNQF